MNVALYARVSTTRQAEHDISIPDQLNQLRAAAEARGWTVVAEFIDAGVSATTDNRPEFQRFCEQACGADHPFDILFIHSFSRYFRDAMEFEFYRRKLERKKVKVVSLTQDFGDGDSAHIAQSMIALFDEHSSRENSKHVRRARLENARQGFWNGGPVPFGYRVVSVAIRGDKIKKQLELEPLHAPVVQLIFRLYLEGDGKQGPMGIIAIVEWMNANGYRRPNGKPILTSFIHRILTNETYIGNAWCNRSDSRTGEERPRSEWVACRVPPIIPDEQFRRAQQLLAERRPDCRAPRLTTSEVIMGGLARCEGCGGALMATSGTSRHGTIYHYYICANGRIRGRSQCPNPTRIRRDLLDDTVLGTLTETLLTPERVQQIVAIVSERRAVKRAEARDGVVALRAKLVEIERKLGRLIDAVIDGTLVNSASVLARQRELELERGKAVRLVAEKEAEVSRSLAPITLEATTVAAAALRDKLIGSSSSLRRRYVQSLVLKVVVGAEEIAIWGSEAVLAQAAVSASDVSTRRVRSSVLAWR